MVMGTEGTPGEPGGMRLTALEGHNGETLREISVWMERQ